MKFVTPPQETKIAPDVFNNAYQEISAIPEVADTDTLLTEEIKKIKRDSAIDKTIDDLEKRYRKRRVWGAIWTLATPILLVNSIGHTRSDVAQESPYLGAWGNDCLYGTDYESHPLTKEQFQSCGEHILDGLADTIDEFRSKRGNIVESIPRVIELQAKVTKHQENGLQNPDIKVSAQTIIGEFEYLNTNFENNDKRLETYNDSMPEGLADGILFLSGMFGTLGGPLMLLTSQRRKDQAQVARYASQFRRDDFMHMINAQSDSYRWNSGEPIPSIDSLGLETEALVVKPNLAARVGYRGNGKNRSWFIEEQYKQFSEEN